MLFNCMIMFLCPDWIIHTNKYIYRNITTTNTTISCSTYTLDFITLLITRLLDLHTLYMNNKMWAVIQGSGRFLQTWTESLRDLDFNFNNEPDLILTAGIAL